MILDFVFCFGGWILVWLMLRRKKLALEKNLVKAVVVGWAIGSIVGSVLYFFSYLVVGSLFDLTGTLEGESLPFAFLMLAVIVFRLMGPAGGLVAFLQWRRKARARLALKPKLTILSTPN